MLTRLLDRLPSLTSKIVTLVGLLGALGVVITVASLSQLRQVEQAYRSLLERDAQAAVLVTAASNHLSSASSLVYAVLTEEEQASMLDVKVQLRTLQQKFHDQFDMAGPLLPVAADQLAHINQQEDQLFYLADSIIEAAARWRGDRALLIIHEEFEPLLHALLANMEQVRSDAQQRFQRASQELSAATERTLRHTAWAFGGALLAVIALAVWLSLAHIAQPVRRLTESMRRLAQRDYQHPIAHTQRRDEIGQMAQALELFRSALQHSDYLEEAKTQAEQLALAKSSFLATMSHEIRTPLNAVIGLAQAALRRTQPPEQRLRMEKIQRAGEHLLGVVNNILDFSKLEGGFLQPERIVFAPQQLLDDVRTLLAGKAAEKSLVLLSEVEDELPLLVGDPLRIRQILFNFVSNAIKFSTAGMIAMRLRLEQEGQQHWLYAEVSDQGIGLSPEQAATLFQPFQQADTTISRRYGGTGLGLAISRSLAELLGGSVGVQSALGQGSRFWLRVRVEQAPAGAQPVLTPQMDGGHLHSPQALQGLRVLLVDDNELNRLVGSELLTDAGMQCDQAEDGQQAIALLEQAADGHYDVVLMDMMMPVLDGCSATRQLRKNTRFAQLPILAMTANTSQQDLQACLDAGMNALVPKPIDEHLLWNAMLQHIPGARSRAAHMQAIAQIAPEPDAIASTAATSTATALGVDLFQPTLHGFDMANALERLDGNQALYLKLAQVFVRENQYTLANLQQALDADDLPLLRLLLHTLHGQAATLGASVVEQAAALAEKAVKRQANGAELQQLLRTLQQCLPQTLGQLQSLLDTQAAVDAQQGDALPLAPPANAPRLLVVDDQPSSTELLAQMLGSQYQVLRAHSGAEALALCRDSQSLPDLILLDILMPGMDGLQVCRRLGEDPLTADIPVLFVTSQSGPQEEAAGLAAGGVDFITKPVNQAVLLARVRTHLQLKAQTDQLRAYALQDGLTGIANRRRFDQALAQEWRYGQRHHRPLALLLIDIDHFKRYNDHYGHPAGDECLKAVAAQLHQAMGRAHDLVARYGGEEFACLLPSISVEDALFKAQALCHGVAALRLPHEASPLAAYVTVSVGVALWTFEQEGQPQQLIDAADAALYAAKSAGRNQVSLAAATGPAPAP